MQRESTKHLPAPEESGSKLIEANKELERKGGKKGALTDKELQSISELMLQTFESVRESMSAALVDVVKQQSSLWNHVVKQITPSLYLAFDEAFYQPLAKYLVTESGQALSDLLNEPRYTVKDADLAYRVATLWETEGVLPATRPKGKGWRKFNIKEAVVLRAIKELRELGFSLERLRAVREAIETLHLHKTNDKSRGLLLEFYLSNAIATRTPTYLIVFSDCSVELVSYTQYAENLQHFLAKDHIVITLNSVLEWFFPEGNLSPEYKHQIEVSDEELEVLFLLRTATFESVTLHKRDNKLHRIEVEEIVNGPRRIVDILNEEDYQRVEIEKRNGSIVMLKRRISKLL